MLSLRAHAWIAACLFAALIGIPILGNTLYAMGMGPPSRAVQLPLMVFYLAIFLAFALSTVPVIVMTVLRAQANNRAAAGLIRHQKAIIWTLWVLMLLGTAIAVPAMVADGFFAAPALQSP